MDWVMRKAVRNCENGIRWRLTSKMDDLYFADDISLFSSTKQQIQDKTTRLDQEARRVGLKINIDKAKVMRINTRNQDAIKLRGQDIQDVEQLTYLGATVNKEGGGMKYIKNRLSKARGAFVRMKQVCNSSNISRRTKVKLYKSLIIPVLLLVLVYGCETWKMNKGDDKRVDVFHNMFLRRIFRICWQDHVSTEELLERTRMKPINKR